MRNVSPFCAALLVAVMMLQAAPWYVVFDPQTGTCLRQQIRPTSTRWRVVGRYASFRQAGMAIWEARPACKSSPVFAPDHSVY
jgi:hypothetical protein